MPVSVYSDKKFLVFIQIWWVLVILMQYGVLRQSNVDNYHAAVDSVITNVLLGFLCFLLSNNMRYYLPRRERYWYIIASTVVICIVWVIVSMLALMLILPAHDPHLSFFRKSSGLRFGAAFLMTSSLTMFSLLFYTQHEQQEAEAREAEVRQLSKEGELFKLRQQLQPHFLFNSLNSISSLTRTDPDKARHMIQQLSDFLRGMMRKDDEKMIRLHDELNYIHLYLEIEKVRFGHRLQTVIDCADDVADCVLPPLVLQPVVENAIKFGLYETVGDVLIQLRAERIGNDLFIRIRNPFDAESSQPAKGTGFGIASISRRLFLLFSRSNLIRTYHDDADFVTEIIIPQT